MSSVTPTRFSVLAYFEARRGTWLDLSDMLDEFSSRAQTIDQIAALKETGVIEGRVIFGERSYMMPAIEADNSAIESTPLIVDADIKITTLARLRDILSADMAKIVQSVIADLERLR